jgi:hypothetical protein
MPADNVVPLRPVVRVRQDAGPIASLYRNLGTASAEQVVTRALTELALTMANTAALVQAQDLGDVARQLRRLQRMSENLGLTSLAVVSCDARDCLDRADGTSFAAVWARLVQVAERSLSGDGPRQDQTRP